MGCDHLICKKCKIGFDLEGGSVFWVGMFLQYHWHTTPKLRGSYFEVSFADFPNHLVVRHRIPVGYISVRISSMYCKEGNNWVSGQCFHREHILRDIRQINQQKKLGKWKKGGYDIDPFIVRKNNPDHDYLRSC
jgi:hypothetical protein